MDLVTSFFHLLSDYCVCFNDGMMKNGRRAFSSFADTYLVAKCYDALLRDAEVKFEAGIAPLYEIKELQARRDEAELRLMELERRLDPEKVAAAKAAEQN